MPHTSLTRTLDLDPSRVMTALARHPGTLLLHGQSGWAGFGRSALLFDPRWVLQADAHGRTCWEGDVPTDTAPAGPADHLLGRLSQPWRRSPDPAGCFTGLAGYLSYDLGPARWGLAASQPAPFETPSAWIGAYDLALVMRDGAAPQLVVVDLDPLVSSPARLEYRADQAEAILEAALESIDQDAQGPRVPQLGPIHYLDAGSHAEAVQRIQRELRAGEVYQVNLTGFATASCTLDPWLAFEHQSRRNPVSFAAYLNAGDWVVSSHSPELLLHLEGERAVTAPIKGTWAASHGDLSALRASAKDRAEHVMIVDLCRNDLGVEAEYGSVHVASLMEPLRLHRLVHMVSRIEARVPSGRRSRLLADLFPGGSVTGAPKRRAMEIITQVEDCARGPYTGSVGSFGRDGRATWNIAIRTAVWCGGELAFGCGGGIVLDSLAEEEHAEAVLKARSFFDTLVHLAKDPHPARAATGAS